MMLARRCLRQLLQCVCSCVNRGLDCLDIFVRVLGPAFILIALALFGFVAYTFFFLVLPAKIEEGMPVLVWGAQAVMGMFLLANLVYNYLMAILVDPGIPPEYAGDRVDLPQGADEELGLPRPKQCQRCGRQKPPRAHHCSVCRRCVLKMDHHCPWINNCVGFHNYRYFCLFMLYLAAACLFVVVVFLDTFLETTFHPRQSHKSFFMRQCTSLSWIIALCIFLSLCLLGGFHTYLVLSNQTTIEFHSNMSNRDRAKKRGELFRNPFDLGRTRNFQQVFGPNEFCRFVWLLPYVTKRPAGDGMSFPSLTELRA